ncbi:MAG: hydantoinase/oxoprolinase family protein [Deltaproteobacteria bacterium]|nr:hydantoinase/oxoprolinase family protein [Deltaproteobacteria bacterium]
MSRVAIDVGGTFTDCLVLDDQGQLSDFKAPTTPEDPSRGLMECLEKAARAERKSVREFIQGLECIIHGTTLATNALLTERGAKVAMLTTEGFRDVSEIRRGLKNVRTSMYNVAVPPYKPHVPRYLRLPIRERTLFTGEVKTPVDLEMAKAAIEQCTAEDVRSIAVCFLHSYANPENERQVAELCRQSFDGRVYVTASHEVVPNWGEYERFSTTVVSAYIGPIVSEYLLALEKQLEEKGLKGGLLMVRSDALVQSAAHSRQQAVTLINSGPAAAPTGALFWGRSVGHNDLISIDMGGTSLDVCLLRKGEIPTTTESWVGDERVAIKMVDIHSIGAAGGSLAWIDSLGLLRVGPQSAGAMPGPACYGRGGDKPTVTDADLILGYIPKDYFLGGEIPLDEERARSAIRLRFPPNAVLTSEIFRSPWVGARDPCTPPMWQNCWEFRPSLSPSMRRSTAPSGCSRWIWGASTPGHISSEPTRSTCNASSRCMKSLRSKRSQTSKKRTRTPLRSPSRARRTCATLVSSTRSRFHYRRGSTRGMT